MKNYHQILTVIFLMFYHGINAQIFFTDESSNSGINVICGNTYIGNGITFYDYDNDGWDDITIGSVGGDPIRFFKNINGFFVQQTINISDNDFHNRQANWVDIDNDGDNDLFLTSDSNGNRLFENLGNMIMQEITSTCGMMTDIFPYFGASWGDYNNDGFLDVFISVRDLDIPNILYKNNGDKTFTLVNSQVGLLNSGYMSFCSAFIDYDNDGDQDIYVSNDKQGIPNLLYRNNGDETFTEVAQSAGAALSIDAMSVTVDDLNSDGWLDIYITNDDSPSVLLMNNKDGTFTDVADFAQVTFNSIGWGAVFLDADNDMDLDLYVSGDTDGSNPLYLSSAFYRNRSNGTFQLEVDATVNDFAESYSNAIGDSDNDGYPEIVVNNNNHNNIFLWKNNTTQNNNWLKVKLEGTLSNRNGVGSFIEISINGEKQYRYTLIGEGYLSQNSGTEIFGLGTSSIVDYVKVKWLSGLEDIFYNVSPNQTLNIVEGSSPLSSKEYDLRKFSYFPNPVENILTLNALSNNINNIVIFNMLGQEVMQLQPNSLNSELDMSSLQTGTYFVKVTVANETKTIRVVKQ
ncbi:VCBS repeat-containing protein [Winogradskyella sp. DF17]|uniref:VCBS repeat-containing protein n=2 Tax=Winogradskyella pelagia TaxID=2819984 RepID=A0ABS3T3P3_9FLAO|nr:VCBS repeat-containing protein [Winogradskyella sp. DF17]